MQDRSDAAGGPGSGNDAGGAEGNDPSADIVAAAAPSCPRCRRLRLSLAHARRQIERLEREKEALREELLSAGEMIEALAEEAEQAHLR